MIKIWRYWIIRPRIPLLAAQFTLVAAVMLRVAWLEQTKEFVGALPQNTGLILLLVLPQVCLYFRRYQSAVVGESYANFLAEALSALSIGLIAAVLLFWTAPKLFPGPDAAAVAVGISTLLLLWVRPFLLCLFRHKKFVERLLVLGSGEMASRFYQELAQGKSISASDNGNSHRPSAPLAMSAMAENKECGTAISFAELREITVRDGISRIVVAEPNVYSSQALAVALLDCKLRGLEVEQAVESYEKFAGKMWLEGIRPDWLVYSEGFNPPRYYLQIKRLLDAICACILMVFAAPVLALTALIVRLDSKGPVLFRQERVGWQGRHFVLLKFRTMREDAEQTTGPVWAGENDPRITRVGRWMRKFRLDELPQLVNVLRGEMSLVGPRPERPHFVKLLTECVPYYGLRHCVKPGVTGWAQVLYPYGASVADAYEKLQYDLYYAKHMSLGFDARILFRTLRVVLFGRGR